MEEINLMPLANRNLQNQFEELRQRASLDALSGLLNRATLEQSIKKRLQEMAPGDTCALFIVDLDDFKQVNDTLGHQRGIRPSASLPRFSPACSGPRHCGPPGGRRVCRFPVRTRYGGGGPPESL